MSRVAAVLLLLIASGPLAAQTDLSLFENRDVEAEAKRAVVANGARLRGLDKVSGDVVDLDLSQGEVGEVGRLTVQLGECRYPEDNSAGEAFAWLTIRDPERGNVVFEGWMVASSPALNALDHVRYDVWVMRCTTA